MGILSGLSNLGLGSLEDAALFKKEEKKTEEKQEEKNPQRKELDEGDFVFEKKYTCSACDKMFTDLKVKTGKARLIRQDKDLRPVYAGIDTLKYDIVSCPYCGYSAFEKWFAGIAPPQVKLIKENISRSFRKFKRGSLVSYDEAIERYKLTLANCIVKKSKDSEKAYVCLRMAWVVRGKSENLDKDIPDYDALKEELAMDEQELLHNALEGFISARETEMYPIAGMDEVTLDYLLAVLCMNENRLDEAGRYIMHVLQSRVASSRIKNKALDIKEEILEKRKNA